MDEENKNIENVTEPKLDTVAEGVKEETAETVEETVKDAAEEAAEEAETTAEDTVQTVEEAADTVEVAAEDAAETVEEAAEEAADAAEDVAEAAEEAADVAEDVAQTAEEAVDTAETAAEDAVQTVEEAAEKTPIEVDNRKGMPRFALAAILAVAVVLIAGILVLSLVLINSRGGGRYYKQPYSIAEYPYANEKIDYDAFSKKYTDTTGQTIEDLADSIGMEYEELLMLYRLPKDFPKTMSENTAQCAIPVGRMCELRKSTLEGVKEEMGWGDDITESTPYGEALDKTLLKNAVGEEYVEEFKTEIGLGDDVTGDTVFGDIRPQYEQFMKDMTEKQNATPAPASETEAAEAATEAAADANN